jgi:hypothetical protein
MCQCHIMLDFRVGVFGGSRRSIKHKSVFQLSQSNFGDSSLWRNGSRRTMDEDLSKSITGLPIVFSSAKLFSIGALNFDAQKGIVGNNAADGPTERQDP